MHLSFFINHLCGCFIKVSFVRNVVGLEDEAAKIISLLTEETEELDVISIIGMPGLGKTTLAGKIYRDPTIAYEFPIRLWVNVSQQYRVRDIFLSVLRDLSWITEDMYDKTDLEIAQALRARLDKESRNEEVARATNHYRTSHKLRFLNLEESRLLLKFSVFGNPNCPVELETLGGVIADMCGGLPLVIMLVAGVLAKIASTGEMKVMQSSWKKFTEILKTFVYDDLGTRFQQIVSFSCNALPSNLKPSFLYLGMFPEDFEIPIKRLILLWIAEGFIEQKTEISLEETAKHYLEDLIDRNLVMTDKIQFLIYKGRHISIDFNNVMNFISSQPYGPRVRSLCSSREEIILLPTDISAIADAFKLTRVLDVRSIRFTRFPFYLTQLVHLRHIALTSDFKVLPEAISKWWNIQTIIVFTSSRVLEIKADIWKMVHLRHLETNASVILCKAGAWKAADGGFRQLEVLKIEYTNLVLWEASSHHFPNLQELKLRNCEELEALPFGLADVSSLQVIDLHRTTKLAAASAREIQQETDTKGRRLKLSIFPSYE
ncbi:UNVERIFIED_CONTAM: putative late blight resistance proteinR1A-10 [Sesamum calycinum]|uniref:Late blight resistance proteinR1A-10 n=1 Tax=Sesamum calycinum TaxID=2727403 RepID=A0AAW2NEF2_9LAMI